MPVKIYLENYKFNILYFPPSPLDTIELNHYSEACDKHVDYFCHVCLFMTSSDSSNCQ